MSEPVAVLDTGELHGYGETLKSRRTIHFFQPQPVPTALLREAIEVARWAPNHRVTEPWHFFVLGKDTTGKVIRLIVDTKAQGRAAPERDIIEKRLTDIPNWLVVTCKLSGDNLQQQEDYAACACAIQNMMLYLWQAGVGVKWTTGKVIQDPRLFELLKLDMNKETIAGLFWCGYPKTVPKQKRRGLDEICTLLE